MENNLCPNCKTPFSKIEFECSNCKFPISGTEKEKAVFIGKQIANKSKIDDAKSSQGKVKTILYIIGLFQLFNAFLSYKNGYDNSNTIFFIVLGVLFVAFGFLSAKKPTLFISLALVLLLSYYGLLYVIDPNYLFNGIVWKFVAIAFLVYGLVGSFEERKLKKQNDFLKQ
ncbi:hypothetical protein [uncultured Psychroserpens sp.]|uniref:hypothetical protein n=1 Tax=uncultured Psychroserpens sp. TaxID=255436 RepID=UPI002636D769|nr:hypothetical protein [uncultured Psychroserpens sp.]